MGTIGGRIVLALSGLFGLLVISSCGSPAVPLGAAQEPSVSTGASVGRPADADRRGAESNNNTVAVTTPLAAIGVPTSDGRVVIGRTEAEVGFDFNSAKKSFSGQAKSMVVAIPKSSHTTPPISGTVNTVQSFVTSVNLAVGGAVNANGYLPLGNITVVKLSDNLLKICGVGGNQQCNKLQIGAYTTSLPAPNAGVPGFVNTAGNYGVDIVVSGANPNTALPLHPGGSAIAFLKDISLLNKVEFGDVKLEFFANMANAGAGSYKTKIVIEYWLSL